MFPLGHAAVGYLVYSAGARRDWLARLDATVLVALLVGTQFPDLVDKPLAWYLGILSSGRSLGHSLFFLAAVSALVVAVASRFDRRAVGVAFVLGAVLHTLVDAAPILWSEDGFWQHLFYPLLSEYATDESNYTVLGILRDEASEPYFWFEHALVVVAVVRWWLDDAPGLDGVRRLAGDAAPAAES